MLRAAWSAPAKVAAHLERSAILRLAIDDRKSFIFLWWSQVFWKRRGEAIVRSIILFLVVGNVAVFSS